MSNTEIEFDDFDDSEKLEIEFEDENDSTDGIEEILPVTATAECSKMQQNQHQILKIQIFSSGYKKDILSRYSNHKPQAKEQAKEKEQEKKDSSDDEDDNKLAIYSDIEDNIENDKNEVTEVTEITEVIEISDDEIIIIDDDNISDSVIVIKEEPDTYEIDLETIKTSKTIESIDEINEKNTSRLNAIKTSDIYVTYLKNKNYLKYVLTDKSYFSINKKTVIEYKEKIKNSKSDFETALYKRNILSYEKLINDEEEKYDKTYMWNKANESTFKNLENKINELERLQKFGIDKLKELKQIEDQRILQEKKQQEEKRFQNIIQNNNRFIIMLDSKINYFTLNSKPHPIMYDNFIDIWMKEIHSCISFYEQKSYFGFMTNNDVILYYISDLNKYSKLFSNILCAIFKLSTYNHKNNMFHNSIWNSSHILYILFITSEHIFNNNINTNIPLFSVTDSLLLQKLCNIIEKANCDINEIFINQDLQNEFRLTIIETVKFCKILLLHFLVSKNIEINIPLKSFPFPPYITQNITKDLSNINIQEKRKAEEMSSSSTEESSSYSSEPKKICI